MKKLGVTVTTIAHAFDDWVYEPAVDENLDAKFGGFCDTQMEMQDVDE